MADEVEVLLHLFEEEREQARQSENQRATLSNIVILVVGAGLAFVTNRGFGKSTLAISIPMIVLGLYGALATAKFFERWYRHWRRAYAYREQLFERFPDIDSKLREYNDLRLMAGAGTGADPKSATGRFRTIVERAERSMDGIDVRAGAPQQLSPQHTAPDLSASCGP
jgi:hypothetical protein